MSLTTSLDNIYKKGVIGNVRKAQEDSHDIFLKTPNGDVFVVCDGMGGHVGGAVASSTAVNSIKAYLEREQYPTPFEALNGALQFANMQILGYANEHPELKGMGTTACIVMFQGDEAWIAHVGDSRIYLFLGQEKKLHRITKDHSFVQTLVDAGQITDEEAEHHPNKNRILKALGIVPELTPTFNDLPIHPKNGDVFLICSDGLSGMIPDSTIEKVLSENDLTLGQKGDKLIDLAMIGETVQPGGLDNCTVELIQIDNSPWKERVFQSFNPARSVPAQEGPNWAELCEKIKQAEMVDEPNVSKAETPNNTRSLSPKIIAAFIVMLLIVLGAGGWLILSLRAKLKQMETVAKLKDDIEKYNDTIEVYSDSIKGFEIELPIAENDFSASKENWEWLQRRRDVNDKKTKQEAEKRYHDCEKRIDKIRDGIIKCNVKKEYYSQKRDQLLKELSKHENNKP